LDLGKAKWLQHLRIVGVPRNFLENADPSPYHILIARLARENVATAMAFDHAGDCGIYNVGTVGHARRRGIGTARTFMHIHDALGRGCTTGSVQATPMAEGVYATAGFRDVGCILEYIPPPAERRSGAGPGAVALARELGIRDATGADRGRTGSTRRRLRGRVRHVFERETERDGVELALELERC
jgi:hypothetical protein